MARKETKWQRRERKKRKKRKPQADPLSLGGEERFEDLAQVLRGDPHPRVGEGDGVSVASGGPDKTGIHACIHCDHGTVDEPWMQCSRCRDRNTGG